VKVGVETVDVVIVGAGVAGLTAAVALHGAGLAVTVLEARPRVGGRLLTLNAEDGPVDLGATWFWAGESHVESLLRDLALPSFDQWTAGDGCYDTHAGIQRLRGNPIDVPAGRYGGGAQALALALAAQLPEGTVRTGAEVRAISSAGDHVAARIADGGEVSGRRVIVALPPALTVAAIEISDDLVDVATTRIAQRTPVWMGQIVKVVCTYDEPFWRYEGLAGSAMSNRGPLGEIHDMSGPDGSPGALFGFARSDLMAGQSLTEVTNSAVAQLGRIFGPRAAKPRETFAVDWSTERFTSPPFVHPQADFGNFGHPAYQPAPGARLLWASTETSRIGAGHVEGAIRAGLAAAGAAATP
jgi:monoamine oxidase